MFKRQSLARVGLHVRANVFELFKRIDDTMQKANGITAVITERQMYILDQRNGLAHGIMYGVVSEREKC